MRLSAMRALFPNGRERAKQQFSPRPVITRARGPIATAISTSPSEKLIGSFLRARARKFKDESRAHGLPPNKSEYTLHRTVR